MTPTEEGRAAARDRGYLDGFNDRPPPTDLHEVYIDAYAQGRRIGTARSGRLPPPPGRWPRLLVVWPEHPPRHVMHAVQHQLAALVWARSGDASWDVRVGAGAERGNVPSVWVELVLWHDHRYPHQRRAEDVLERVRGEVERGQR